jgi:hypothetical protein
VRKVSIDRDEKRELLTLLVTDRDGTSHPARALSDGTLRFLALAVLALEPEADGLLCLEEPENGIHPERIPAMLDLLRYIATDVAIPSSAQNPLRQVIINTHSPAVVTQVPEDSLLVAELQEKIRDGRRFKRVRFSSLPGTWRQRDPEAGPPISRGALLAYLNPVIQESVEPEDKHVKRPAALGSRRVMDRPDLQLLLPHILESA